MSHSAGSDSARPDPAGSDPAGSGSLDWSGFSDEDPDRDGGGDGGGDTEPDPDIDPVIAAGLGPDAGGRGAVDRGKTPEADREADPYGVARAIVLRQLTAAPRSRRQLASKLAERHVPPEVAEAVLDRFEEVKLINDREFAEMWVRSRTQTKALAKGALRRELADKGITGELAEDALGGVTDEDEQDRARTLVRKKLRTAGEITDRAERDKFVRRTASMLARKGYSASLAFGIVNQELDAYLAAGD